MQAGLSTLNAPAPRVVLPYYGFGAIAFLISGIILFIAAPDMINHYLSPKLLSLTHLLVLGWISMIIFGALYQLIPVVMEVKLYSERLALITFFLFGTGILILVWSFWFFKFQRSIGLEIGGVLLILTVMLFAVNMFKSALKTERRNIENGFIVTSIVYLMLTVILGFLMVLNFMVPFIPRSHLDLLKLHAHLGMIGWFLLLVIGVASKLMPMFLIVHKLPVKLLSYSFYLINAGLILLALAFYFYPKSLVLTAFSLLILAGILFFLRFVFIAFKKRIRRKLDIGMRFSALAFILLFISLLLGVVSVLSPGIIGKFQVRLEIIYGVLIILGFFTSLILGQTYKTLPFIIWLQKYQSKVGKEKTPLPMELYSEKVAVLHFWTYLAGLILLITGILFASSLVIRIAAIIFIVTGLLYNYNVFKIILHKALHE